MRVGTSGNMPGEKELVEVEAVPGDYVPAGARLPRRQPDLHPHRVGPRRDGDPLQDGAWQGGAVNTDMREEGQGPADRAGAGGPGPGQDGQAGGLLPEVVTLTGQALRDEPEAWPVHATEEAWRGAAPFAVRVDEISVPDEDDHFSRLIVEHPGAVVVLALDDDDRVLVLRQYRHAAGHRLVELPAGLLDQPGEDPLEAGRRELWEEAGLEAGHWEYLTTFHNSPGITTERIALFLARELRAVDREAFEPAHEEADMTVHWVPLDELVTAILDGRVADGPLLVAVLLHVVRHLRNGGV